jgi:hypothetical protein
MTMTHVVTLYLVGGGTVLAVILLFTLVRHISY